MTTPSDSPVWLPVKAVAASSGVPVKVLRAACRRGDLSCRRAADGWMLPATVVAPLRAEMLRPIIGERDGSAVVAARLDDGKFLAFRCPFCGLWHHHGAAQPHHAGYRSPHCADDGRRPPRDYFVQPVPDDHKAAPVAGDGFDWGRVRAGERAASADGAAERIEGHPTETET